MAGATVVPGIEDFGADSRIHRAAILDLSTDLPITIEFVDIAERVAQFRPLLDEMMIEGLIVVLDCEVVKYVHSLSKISEPTDRVVK